MSDPRNGSILFYWHDMWLPHSRFIVESFDKLASDGRTIILAGPAERSGASAIFNVPGSNVRSTVNVNCEYTDSYPIRETVCRFREWRRLVKTYSPDVIFVADEGMSLNTLLAGMANSLFGKGIVLFYGFENIVQSAGWNSLVRKPTLRRLGVFLRKAVRVLVLERMLMPTRRRVVHGGLVSYEACAQVVRSYRWNPLMRACWWPIDVGTFRREGARMDLRFNQGLVVGFVGRFVEEKGVLLLIEAAARVGVDVKFVFVGDGPVRDEMDRKIKLLGLSERCEIVPPLQTEELAKFYRAIDLLVLPSMSTETWKEQFGRVLVEARCCGVKVAGTDCGAIPAVVCDPNNICAEGSVSALATLIEREVRRRDEDIVHPTAVGPDVFMETIFIVADECRGAVVRRRHY